MRRGGARFWLWTNSRIPMRTHEELLASGEQIEVQARVSQEGQTQVFIGVYGANGWVIREETQDRQVGEHQRS